MNDALICTQPLYTFEGFVVRQGWLFGTNSTIPFVTRGYVNTNASIKVWILKSNEWNAIYINASSPLYSKILKGIRKRERKNILPLDFAKDTRTYEDAKYQEQKTNNNNSVYKKGTGLSANCYKSNWYTVNMSKPKY